MKLIFFGVIEIVIGLKYLVEYGGWCVFIDCGLF